MPRIKGRFRVVGYKAGTKEIVTQTEWKENLMMQGSYTGIGLVLAALAGDNTYSLNLTYLAIGTSQTAPAITDTQLGAEVARGSILNQQVSVGSGTVTVQTFIPDSALANGSYSEVGAFCAGSASLNSGQIFDHVVLSSVYTKGSGQDTTIQAIFTI